MNKTYRIIVIGQSWHGSDCTGLARGFRALGHAVELISSDQFFPKNDRSFSSRLLSRIISPFYITQFNQYILKQVSLIQPEIVVVFKGNFVQPQTLEEISNNKAWLCNFYPDVSFMCHGSVNIDGFKFYQHIFTTKSFGLNDFEDQLGIKQVSFLPHGFDPYVHRPLNANSTIKQDTDISFIGTWSPHKDKMLSHLVSKVPEHTLCIWGNQWEKSKSPRLKNAIVGHGVMGDFYALAIGKSKINLGLLSEKRPGASSGDQITSRTFHIPASGGFLLHQRTEEVLEYYQEDKEIACFDTSEELVDKVRYYLENEEERLQIAKAGYNRCIREDSLSNRAQTIIEYFEKSTR